MSGNSSPIRPRESALVPAARLAPTVKLAALGCPLALVVGLLSAVPAVAAADPVAPADAPRLTEGFAPYLPQVSCDPAVKPGMDALRNTLLAAYGGRDLGITRVCDAGGRSEHKEGRAWDWGLDASVPADKAIAGRFFEWLFAPGPGGMPAQNARRLGVMYVIYDGRIWSSYRATEGWRPYAGGESHAGHIHISLAWNGAQKRTSWWTGKAADIDYGPCVGVEGAVASPWQAPRATECPPPVDAMSLTGTPRLARDSTGGYVIQLQRILSVSPVSGFFGPITEGALTRFQRDHGLAATGVTSHATWAALRQPQAATPAPAPVVSVSSARSLPARMRYVVRRGDTLGGLASRWRSTVAAIRSASGLRGDLIRTGQTIVIPVRSGITKFTWTSLRRGDEGVAVTALQSALRMRPRYRTGLFGDITRGRVRALKGSRGWPVDGKAGPGVWRALGA